MLAGVLPPDASAPVAGEPSGAEPVRVRLTPDEVVAEFLPILRAGLPVRPETAGQYLPFFPIVLAHAKDTGHLSRVLALDEIVTSILKDWPPNEEGKALGVLFGLRPAHRGWTLTKRQVEAATAIDVSPDHLRKHRQAKLLELLTYEFLRRNERYKISPSRHLLLDEVPDAGRFQEGDDLELLEYQARCTAEMFLLRADLLAIARGQALDAPVTPEELLRSSLAHYVALQRLIRARLDKYGISTPPEDPGLAIPKLEVLLGGYGPFSESDLAELVHHFMTQPQDDPSERLCGIWREWALNVRPSRGD